MTVTSVLYRSAVGRSALPYCNSDVIIKVGGRQVDRLKKYTFILLRHCLHTTGHCSSSQFAINIV